MAKKKKAAKDAGRVPDPDLLKSPRLALLTRVGIALHGAGWISGLAKDLGVGRTTVHYWSTGINPIPDWLPSSTEHVMVLGALSRLLMAKQAGLDAEVRAKRAECAKLHKEVQGLIHAAAAEGGPR